jgi:hypothetical protein
MDRRTADEAPCPGPHGEGKSVHKAGSERSRPCAPGKKPLPMNRPDPTAFMAWRGCQTVAGSRAGLIRASTWLRWQAKNPIHELHLPARDCVSVLPVPIPSDTLEATDA